MLRLVKTSGFCTYREADVIDGTDALELTEHITDDGE